MIHQYQNNGYNIVLDVNSGAVHVVDQEAYDVIEVLNRMNEDHTVSGRGGVRGYCMSEPYERESDSADTERRKYMEPAER